MKFSDDYKIKFFMIVCGFTFIVYSAYGMVLGLIPLLYGNSLIIMVEGLILFYMGLDKFIINR